MVAFSLLVLVLLPHLFVNSFGVATLYFRRYRDVSLFMIRKLDDRLEPWKPFLDTNGRKLKDVNIKIPNRRSRIGDSGILTESSDCENIGEIEAEAADLFFHSIGVKCCLHDVVSAVGWRTNAKLAVQSMSKWGGVKMGLFRPGSHEVATDPKWRDDHHPSINEAIDVVQSCAVSVGVSGYSHSWDRSGRDTTAPGQLRYVQLVVQRTTGKVQLVLVWNAQDYKSSSPELPRFVKALRQHSDLWHSIHVNFQTSTKNAIFNQDLRSWRVLWGPSTMKETIGNVDFLLVPQGFRQANLDCFESQVLPLVVNKTPVGSRVAELYAGVGVIGLNLASRADSVVCSDSNVFAQTSFDLSASSLPQEDAHRVSFEALSTDEAIQSGQCADADVLIADPPRRGLDGTVMDLLVRDEPANDLRRFIYVSCGLEALRKECRLLLSSGKWDIHSADVFSLFPGTGHVECVVVFDRVLGASKRRRRN